MASEPFRWRITELSVNFQKLFLCANGMFEEQNKVSEPSIISINP